MSAANASERTRIARIGAHAMHSVHDARVTGANGLKAAALAVDRQLTAQLVARGLDPESPDFSIRLEHARKQRRLAIAQAGVKARKAKRAK